ncbi:MAG: nucleoside hydrolase [Pseudomonadales bacterium]
MTQLIIDTDVALGVWHEGRPRDIDDGFAIVEAINSDALQLLGITCVYGNGPLSEVVRVAQEIVDLKGADIPVIAGAPEAMKSADDPSNQAVEFIADQLRAGRLSIAAIGPLTNMGLLVRHHPDLLSNIDQVIIVAGRSEGADFYIGDDGPVRDFNFENDVLAADLLMAAGVPLVLMGFELTSQVCVTELDLEGIRAHGGDTAEYFYTNSLAWCHHWTRTFPQDAGFHPWDSAAIAWLLNRNWFAAESRGHRVQYDPPRLECAPGFSGPAHTYCSGFQAGGQEAFVKSVIEHVY